MTNVKKKEIFSLLFYTEFFNRRSLAKMALANEVVRVVLLLFFFNMKQWSVQLYFYIYIGQGIMPCSK
jgi:hypothetical protein